MATKSPFASRGRWECSMASIHHERIGWIYETQRRTSKTGKSQLCLYLVRLISILWLVTQLLTFSGAGQAGLTIAARLKMLSVKSLIVDREERVGDNWRTRYHQLVLHDPVWFDHLPYLPFPENWPIFTPKDKLGDWFESYVKLLELNAWTQTSITKSSWDEAAGKWTVTLNRVRDGKTETRVLHPKVCSNDLLHLHQQLTANSTLCKPPAIAASPISLHI